MTLNVAVGFVTGRKHFLNILLTHVNNWLEHGLVVNKNIRLHLMVAYDLKYAKTEVADYKNVSPEVASMIDSIRFYGKPVIEREKEELIKANILDEKETERLFGDGYAKKRNAILYFAIKRKMDRLIFLDDDEYPVAVMKNNHGQLIWMGQSVVGNHIKYSEDADITHGHHCGYISAIPYIRFNELLALSDFKKFISAVSNEIISWKSVKRNIIENHGVTYADKRIITRQIKKEVQEKLGMKFISGANLCFNLARCGQKLPPFYNPPGARGEDTFMSTALTHLKVLKIPVYTFHDGFMHYKQLLMGNLPTTLQPVEADSAAVLKRFISVTIGWVRYKPLMIYITQRSEYETIISKMKSDLEQVIPKFNERFHTHQFSRILSELAFYDKNVKKHFQSFRSTRETWEKLMGSVLSNSKNNLSLLPSERGEKESRPA